VEIGNECEPWSALPHTGGSWCLIVSNSARGGERLRVMHVGYLTVESPYETAKGGGIAAYLRAVVPELVRAGHRVTVITNSPEDRESVDGQVRVVNVRLPNWHWYVGKLPLLGNALALPLRQLEWSRSFARTAARIVANDPLDVLESTEAGALFLARWPIAPLVIRLHGSDYVFRKYAGQPLHQGTRWNHRLEQSVWRRAAALTTPSRFHAEEVATGLGWQAERVHVVPNPIAPEVLAEALRQGADTRTAQQCPLVLYTGRLAAVKGITPYLDAIRLVRSSDSTVRFVLAGPWQMGDTPEQLGLRRIQGTRDTERVSAANGSPSSVSCTLADGVAWLGHVAWQDLIEWYRRAALFVMPSYYETFGISCLEAMAFGLPVIATRTGGLPEVVEDGVTGVLVPPGDARALAEAIQDLLRRPELRSRMGQAGRERVLARFTADEAVRQTLRVYDRVNRLPEGGR
jgi:glycosyltransferase involved in cell wall biosynthesis